MIPEREEQAKIEIGHTKISSKITLVLMLFFLLIIILVPLIHFISRGLEKRGSSLTYERAWAPGEENFLKSIQSRNAALMQKMKAFEERLEENSPLSRNLIGPVQTLFLRIFHLGNEKALVGKEGWYFYEPGLHYLTEPFGNEPLECILDFKAQLEERGIELILMPVPVKGMFYPQALSSRFDVSNGYLQNPSYEALNEELIHRGVKVADGAQWLQAEREDIEGPLFLKTDTHWTPQAMSLVAQNTAALITETIPLNRRLYLPMERTEQKLSHSGDIAQMLRLPEGSNLIEAEDVSLHPVLMRGNEPWAPEKSAEILFLGDSFSNIYSHPSMGWGESAGLVEQLSYYLKRPIDRIVQNDNGAYATRQALQYEMMRGRDPLAGKKVVIWEFAMRELLLGDWKILKLQLQEAEPAGFYTPEEGTEALVSGIIYESSSRPIPGTTPYKDHVMSFHLVDAQVEGESGQNLEILVYGFSMEDNQLTSLAQIQPGQRVTMKVQNWYDVMEEYNSYNRSEIDNETLWFADPVWCKEIMP